MKALIVAHPDDEIIWFPSQYFDLIVIVFLARHDKPYAEHCRRLALDEHPLKERIILLKIDEPGYWKDKNRKEHYNVAKVTLYHSLLKLKSDYTFKQIFTHNSFGEYGHDDHILVHESVKEVFGDTEIYCPTITNNDHHYEPAITMKNDLNFYEKVKQIYIKHKAWTWKLNYVPPEKMAFYLSES